MSHFKLLLTTLITFSASIVFAEEPPPKLELGIGIGGLSIPHYRGSDQTQEYIAPIPYVRYNGDRLKVDREGARFYFLKNGNFKLDLSAGFNFPVDSDDNRARQGMPDLDPVIELGPRAQFDLYTSKDRDLRIRAALPVRLAIVVDSFSPDNTGWIFSPYLQIRYYSGWETALSVGPVWATEKYHDYFYQVDPTYATAGRPEYDARAGYSGFRYTLTTSKRINKRLWFGAFARYDSLSGAVFEDSPLVKQSDALFVGIGIAYIFKSSSTPEHVKQ